MTDDHEEVTARLRALEEKLKVLRSNPRPLRYEQQEKSLVGHRLTRLEKTLKLYKRDE